MAFLGRHYKIPIAGLASGTVDNTYILEFRTPTNYFAKVTYIQGHFENPSSSDQISMALIRASVATAGNAIVPTKPTNQVAASITASDTPTAVTPSGLELSHFGGIASSPWQWYAPNDGPGDVLRPGEIVVLIVRIAPATSRILRGEIGIEEL